MSDFDHLPFRPCAGVMLVNDEGRVFVGQRVDSPSEAWQMPQGGIDKGEEAETAALRELQEETGVDPQLVSVIARSKAEHFYDLPIELKGKIWGGKYRGQRQTWFLLKFNGRDADINIETEHQEFRAWRWSDLAELEALIVPFKRELYQAVIQEFTPYLNSLTQ